MGEFQIVGGKPVYVLDADERERLLRAWEAFEGDGHFFYNGENVYVHIDPIPETIDLIRHADQTTGVLVSEAFSDAYFEIGKLWEKRSAALQAEMDRLFMEFASEYLGRDYVREEEGES